MTITIDGSNGIISTSTPTFQNYSLVSSPVAGELEYNGTSMYFTPTGTQRGLIPARQMFVLNTAVTGTNATGNQSLFGLTNGVTLAANTIYAFEIDATISKSAGTTSHTISFGFTSTATLNSIIWDARVNDWPTTVYNTWSTYTNQQAVTSNTTSATQTTGSLSIAVNSWTGLIKGIVSVNASGTLNPVYALSAAPGGAYTTQIGSYMHIYPIGTGTSNVSIGTWS